MVFFFSTVQIELCNVVFRLRSMDQLINNILPPGAL